MPGDCWHEGTYCIISLQKSHPHSWALTASHMCMLKRKATAVHTCRYIYTYIHIAQTYGTAAAYNTRTRLWHTTCGGATILDLCRNSPAAHTWRGTLAAHAYSKNTEVCPCRSVTVVHTSIKNQDCCCDVMHIYRNATACIYARTQMFYIHDKTQLICTYVRTWLLWMFSVMLLLCSYTWLLLYRYVETLLWVQYNYN